MTELRYSLLQFILEGKYKITDLSALKKIEEHIKKNLTHLSIKPEKVLEANWLAIEKESPLRVETSFVSQSGKFWHQGPAFIYFNLESGKLTERVGVDAFKLKRIGVDK